MATAQLGDYRVEAELGRGACAVVYRVRHRTQSSLHALKLLVWNSVPLRRRLAQEGSSSGPCATSTWSPSKMCSPQFLQCREL